MSHHFPLYLLYGNEPFLIAETRKKIVNEHLDEDTYDFNLAVYDLQETPVEVGLQEAETLPFMADKRVVILTNPYFLTTEKQSKTDHDLKKLEAYIQNPSPHAVVIIEARYDKLDERKKIVKALKASAKVIPVSPLKDASLFKQLQEEAKKLHISIERNALEKLVYLVGTDLQRLQSELEKFALYVGNERAVTTDVVDQLVARSLEDNVFSLIDHVASRRIDQAFRTLYDLFAQNEEPIKINALLARQFRLIFQVKELKKKGFTNKQMASSLKVHPYVITLADRQGKNFSQAACIHYIQVLAETDYHMKTGLMDKQLALEMLLTKI